MKKLFLLLLISVAVSCSKSTEKEITEITFNVKNIENSDGVAIIRNLTTQKEQQEEIAVRNNLFTLKMSAGIYNISVEFHAENATHRGYLESVQVTGKELKLDLTTFIHEGKEDFVIEEIFYSGTVYPGTGKGYIGDQYFKITNNADKVLYADGLTIAESAFSSTDRQEYTPNILSKGVTIHALYSVPGNGTTYPVEPGKSIIICDRAMNHKVEAHENSFDLSNADFEWYDVSTNNSTDTDNPAVPNLDKIYCYTLSVWTLHQGGIKSYLLIRMEKSTEEYLKNYKYDFSYTHKLTGKEIHKSELYIPNEWVVDAVNLSSPDKWEWNPVDPSLDAGYTYCGANSTDVNRKGKSVKRKIASTTESGRKILKDTNNSREDFDRDVTPQI